MLKKIDILIPNFEDLGAQRVAINISNILSRKFDINFVVLDDIGPFKSYLNIAIPIVNLASMQINIPKIRVFSKGISYANFVKTRKTDISISFSPITNYYILFAKYSNKNLKTIIQEHAYPTIALKDRGNSSWFNEFIFRNILVRWYNKSDIFLTIANAIQEDFVEHYGVRKDIFRIVRNPLDIDKIIELSHEDVDDFEFKENVNYLIGVGRLSPQKNFTRLIEIFNRLKMDNFELIILGKGELETQLKKQIEEHNLISKVHLLGFKSNPYKYISKANIFCLTSDWEGLPQVIAEAMICKTPVIAHSCKSGPDEMIQNNKSGILVEFGNEEDFAFQIENLINNTNLLRKITNCAFEFAYNEYSIEKVSKKYQSIIEELK